MHTRLQDFGSFSTDLLSDLKLIEQQQNKVNILSVARVWLDSIYILAMNRWPSPVLSLKRGCCSHLSLENRPRNLKWSRGDSCWIHFSKHVLEPICLHYRINSMLCLSWVLKWLVASRWCDDELSGVSFTGSGQNPLRSAEQNNGSAAWKRSYRQGPDGLQVCPSVCVNSSAVGI